MRTDTCNLSFSFFYYHLWDVLEGSFTARVPDQRAQTGTNDKGKKKERRDVLVQRDETEKIVKEKSKSAKEHFSASVEIIICLPSQNKYSALNLLLQSQEYKIDIIRVVCTYM